MPLIDHLGGLAELNTVPIFATNSSYRPPERYVPGNRKVTALDAQMPFGGVESEREPKEKEDISARVTVAV